MSLKSPTPRCPAPPLLPSWTSAFSVQQQPRLAGQGLQKSQPYFLFSVLLDRQSPGRGVMTLWVKLVFLSISQTDDCFNMLCGLRTCWWRDSCQNKPSEAPMDRQLSLEPMAIVPLFSWLRGKYHWRAGLDAQSGHLDKTRAETGRESPACRTPHLLSAQMYWISYHPCSGLGTVGCSSWPRANVIISGPAFQHQESVVSLVCVTSTLGTKWNAWSQNECLSWYGP